MVSSFPILNLLPTTATASPGFLGLGSSNPAGMTNALISTQALSPTNTPNVLSLTDPAGLMNSLAGFNTGLMGLNGPGNLGGLGNLGNLGLTGGGLGFGSNPFAGTLGGIMGGSPVGGIGGGRGSIQNNPQLLASINRIQQDPDGAALLQESLARGYNIRIGDPASALASLQRSGSAAARASCPTCQAAALAVGNVNVLGATITNGSNGNEIILNANSRDFDKTLVHELYHAATDEDGTSKSEEAFANIIGDKVSANVNGRPRRNPQDIINETIPLYPDLPDFN